MTDTIRMWLRTQLDLLDLQNRARIEAEMRVANAAGAAPANSAAVGISASPGVDAPAAVAIGAAPAKWVTWVLRGNTYDVRETLYNANLRWDAAKKRYAVSLKEGDIEALGKLSALAKSLNLSLDKEGSA